MADPAALPPLKEVIARHGIAARKSLGQNFLLDRNLLDRIVRATGDLEGCDVVEIGAGPGGLTRALLGRGARRIVAIEKDPRCIAALRELALAYPDRLVVVEGDALALEPADLAAPPIRLVGNLPFNVGTPLLVRWLRRAERFRSMTLMFQKEVAARLVAPPRTKDYGRLSVLAQWRCEVRALFDVGPRSFVPPPAVTATVVEFLPRGIDPDPAFAAALERVLAAAFGQRRKMLRSSLARLPVPAPRLLAAAGIAQTARAEELNVPSFLELAKALREASPSG
jgi:16S rRNA (adenine1518-N6/adenine1519-N6)-dimethyltransferase